METISDTWLQQKAFAEANIPINPKSQREHARMVEKLLRKALLVEFDDLMSRIDLGELISSALLGMNTGRESLFEVAEEGLKDREIISVSSDDSEDREIISISSDSSHD